MKEYIFHYNFSPIPPIMKRGRHALIVVKTKEDKYVLGAKEYYPEGIYRFVGGGLDKGEDPLTGAVREVEEELKIQIDATELQPLASFVVNIQNATEDVTFITYLYGLTLGKQTIQASDDLDGLVYFTKEEVLELVDRFKHLSPESKSVANTSAKETQQFRWSDYGEFYAEVHKKAMELF